MTRTVLLFALLLTSAEVSAAPPAAQQEPAEEKKICRTERSTGSLTRSRRICMTQAEWDRLRRATKQDIDDMQRNGGAVPRTQGAAGATAGTG